MTVPDRIFRLALNDTVQAKALARMIEYKVIIRIVPICRNDIYGRELCEALNQSFNGTLERGVSYSPNANDLSETLDKLEP